VCMCVNQICSKTLHAMLRWGFLPYLATSLIFVENFVMSWQLILVELIFKNGMYFCVGGGGYQHEHFGSHLNEVL
jgi:hypothetical protein